MHMLKTINKTNPVGAEGRAIGPKAISRNSGIFLLSLLLKKCRENRSCAEKKGMTSKFIHHRRLKTSTQNYDVRQREKKRDRLIDSSLFLNGEEISTYLPLLQYY